jgi:nucleoside-diphosphate-sugar epimerase
MKGDVVNIGNPQEVSILDLAKKIRETAGSASGITFHPLPEDDPKRRRPDITKAEKLLSWKAEVNLEDGLDRTIRWFRDRSLN